MTPVPIQHGLWDGKVCQQIDLGLLQEVLPPAMIEELLETYQVWEERERKRNMIVRTSWLIRLHLYPHLSQRAVSAKLVRGVRASRDEVPQEIPAKSAFRYRREQLGSDLQEERFEQRARPHATAETPGAFWGGMRVMAQDGTVESLPDTTSHRETFRDRTNDPEKHSPFPQARVLLLVECATHLICDAEISPCRQAEASCARRLLERRNWEARLLLWDSGFPASGAIFELRKSGGHVLGRLTKTLLLTPFVRLCDGSSLTYISQDQEHQRGARMLVRVISDTFTDPRIPGAGEQISRLVSTLLDPFLYPAKALAVLSHERWHAELVSDETRTHWRLSARTLRSLTANGVIQERFGLLVAHNVGRTLMLPAALVAQVAPTQISYTQTIHLLHDSLPLLGTVGPVRRAQMVRNVREEIATFRLPTQPVRILARVVTRARSRSERKKPEHLYAPPLELDLDFSQIVALVV